MEEFNPKKINVPYSIAIVKPDVTAKDTQVSEIIKKIEDEGFTIINMLKKPITKEEIINLYYKHLNATFFEQMAKFLQNGECLVLMITKENSNPIEDFKKLLGPSDPVEAKKTAPNSLRALYGTDRIKNAIHGSDTTIDSSKERDIFKFPIPQKVPEFKFDKFKVTLDMLMKFIYPPNLEHSEVNARLDIFAYYGPVLNYHSVDTCFCKKCALIGKDYLQQVIANKIETEKNKLGILTKASSNTNKMGSTKGTSITTKLMISPIRTIDETGILTLWPHLCEKCREHCESFVHLASGKEQQHLLTDNEIKELAYEMNKRDLYDLLRIEKESTADVMIESLDIKEPKELKYNRDIIKLLLAPLETDYYGRYNFQDMQNLILDDRRVRMNAWVASLTGKPLKLFKNPKLLNSNTDQNEIKDPKSLTFTLSRIEPLSYSFRPKDINQQSTKFEKSIVDKKRLQPNEEKLVLLKLLHRNTHHLLEIDNCNSKEHVNSVFLMRDYYNEGRHGGWNNYVSLKGMNKGSYVNTKNTDS